MTATDDCRFVGQGVLSKIVTFADKIFANIAGKSGLAKSDFVSIDSGSGDISVFRNSWRQNY